MTVSSTTSRVSYAGNGSTVTFTVPFYFLAAADLVVIRTSSTGTQTTLVLNTDYTVTGAGVPAGGSVTCTSAPSASDSLVIYRDPATTQLTDYQANDPFPAETHERALDKLTMLAQRLKDLIARSFTLSDGDVSGASTTLPSPASNKLIGWNETATGLQNVDQLTLATVVASGTMYANTFTGNGVQTAWTLSVNPGSINNLDVSIGGVTQLPGVDYTWTSGTTLTTTSAVPNGVKMLVRYAQALPQGTSDSASALFIQSGAGAATRMAQDKMREFVSVKDFGAVGDGVVDDTAAIQAALNAAGIGRVVFLPKGRYKITSTLVLAQSQKLVGESTLAAFKANLYLQLSTIDVYVGQGSTTTPAVLLDLGSGVHGVCFNHPNQAAATATTPIQFGWTIATDTSKAYNIDDVTIRDVMLVNAYRGISLDKSGRFNVENVYGDCISEGIFADRGYDVCRMKDVHIWTFTYGVGTNMMNWIAANGRAFNFNRVDMLVCHGLFQYGRNIGFDFNDAGNGAVWADFFGCMSDVAHVPVRITKAARIRWFGGSLVPYLAAEPCVTTSSDISTVGQGTGQVAFTATQFHDLARCGAVITSSTGNFSFIGCDFERAEVAVINEGTANVSVEDPKTRFGTNSRLTVLGNGANTRFNGVPNPTLSTDVSPSNFGMGVFTAGVPNNWTFLVGSSANIQNMGSGYVRLLYNAAGTSVISYTLPTSIRERRGLFTVRVNVRFFNISDGVLTFWTRRFGGGNEQSVRSFNSFNHGQAIWYNISIICGYDTGTQAFDIEWSSPSGIGSGYVEIAGLSIYEAADSTITQDVIDEIMRREYLDPFGYGAPISKVGGNRTIHQALNPPSAGTWRVNDRSIRYTQAVGQPKAWVCTAAGSPGTWVSEGNL